jgi:hypothetical protein
MASIFDALLDDSEDFSNPEKRAATAAALRKQQNYGTLGQLMGVQPTVRAGEAMQEGAQGSLKLAMAKQQAAKEAAARAEERKQAQMNTDRAFNEDRRQFGLQEARLGAQQSDERRAQWASAVDPITGQMRLYNKYTGEWLDEPGMGNAPGQTPQFNPAMGMKPTEKSKNDLTAIRQQRGSIEGALTSVAERPNAFGFKQGALERFGGDIGTAFAQWQRSPEDTGARSFVLNNVSAIINERAGAAQSAQELARLRGFLPSETDDAARIQAKFNGFLDYLDEREAATRGYSTDELGMARRTGAGPRKPEYQSPEGTQGAPIAIYDEQGRRSQ